MLQISSMLGMSRPPFVRSLRFISREQTGGKRTAEHGSKYRGQTAAVALTAPEDEGGQYDWKGI